ncbi:hypothetical protein ASD04_08510 [Devosia sp. Root436]|jgi:hypothetical protein|uniref:hypothetical protein n=1 Tax=Devosia sp. Root436 TaxID=1736537 RepID=UPI0006F243DB|nr:hypothetical protein [Devosia sp. Root436]KQX38686.1 hypothetical protein ASD04_08510 [Devosia sp. Root436]
MSQAGDVADGVEQVPVMLAGAILPTPSRHIGPVVGELYGLGDPDGAFDFGLERILEGLAVMIERERGGRQAPAALTPGSHCLRR